MSNQGMSALIPFIQIALSLTKSQVGLLASAGQLGNVLSFYGGGWIADSFGVRRLILISTSFIGAGLIGLSRADNLPAVLGVIFLTGVGTGLGGPAITMMVIRAFERRRRGTAMGIKQTGVPAVGLIAALALPPASLLFGWRPAVATMGALAFCLGLWVFLRHREEAVTVVPATAPEGSPGALRSILLKPSILAASLFAVALVALQFCVLSYYILYLTGAVGLDVVAAGQLLALVQGGGVVGRVFWGLVSDRLLAGRRKPVFLLAGGTAAGVAGLLAFLGAGTPTGLLIGVSFVLGASALGWHGIFHTLVAEVVEPHLVGRATGASMTLSQIGPILGPPLFGVVVDATGTYRPAWLLIGAVAALATVLVAVILREAPSGAVGASVRSARSLSATRNGR